MNHRHLTRITILSAVLCAVPTAAVWAGDDPGGDDLTAAAILRRTERIYSTCSSYRDSGLVHTVFIRPDRETVVEQPFTTAFVRPDRFRFEYSERMGSQERNGAVVWQHGDDVRLWTAVDPEGRDEDSLGMAAAAATGISGGSAHLIPRLLLPDEIGGFSLTEVSNPKRIDDGSIDGMACFRITGEHDGSTATIWIDRSTGLVRRVDWPRVFDDFRTERKVLYHPAIDVDIDGALLEYSPPG